MICYLYGVSETVCCLHSGLFINPVPVSLNRYQKLSVATVLATLFLIFVGGLVRAAGAGLGCPDWPTCFGMWIPPTTADTLPPGYDITQFNVLHTWLEYVNRLTGVVIGLLITATFIFSFRYWKTDRVIPMASGLAFLLVLFQGWLGGQVVRTGLSEGLITLHMMLAMVIVTVLLFTAFRATGNQLNLVLQNDTVKRSLLFSAITLLLLILVQMVLGTQVREMIDVVKNMPSPLPREEWIHALDGWLYPVHRSFSWAILFNSILLVWLNRRWDTSRLFRLTSNTVLILVVMQMGVGIGLEQADMPGLFQVSHLLGSALLICSIALHILMIWFSKIPADSELEN